MTESITSPARRLSVAELNERRRAVYRYRAEWLIALRAGAVTLEDVFRQSETTEGSPLMSLYLRDVLSAIPGMSMSKATRIIRRTLEELGIDQKPEGVRVRWVMDRRSRERRVVALADSMIRSKRRAPTETWPW
jgi:hypothetical protein